MVAKKTTEERHSTAIVRLYASLVKAGRRTIETVPEGYRQDVQDYLDGVID